MYYFIGKGILPNKHAIFVVYHYCIVLHIHRVNRHLVNDGLRQKKQPCMVYAVSFNHNLMISMEERTGCFTLIAFLMYCDC